MKALLIFSVTLCLIMSACAPKAKHTGADTRVVMSEDSLPESKKQLLDSLKREWLHKTFDCLYAVDLKPDCGDLDAGGISVGLMIDIDTLGMVYRCQIISEDICGADRQKLHDINSCILKDMSAVVFPLPLRYMKLKFKMSRYVRS